MVFCGEQGSRVVPEMAENVYVDAVLVQQRDRRGVDVDGRGGNEVADVGDGNVDVGTVLAFYEQRPVFTANAARASEPVGSGSLGHGSLAPTVVTEATASAATPFDPLGCRRLRDRIEHGRNIGFRLAAALWVEDHPYGSARRRVVQDSTPDRNTEVVQPVAVVHGLGLVCCARGTRRLNLVDPSIAVEVVQTRGAQVDLPVAVVPGLVDCLTVLDQRAVPFRTEPASEQPELTAAVVQVLDVDSTDIVRVHHRISPARNREDAPVRGPAARTGPSPVRLSYSASTTFTRRCGSNVVVAWWGNGISRSSASSRPARPGASANADPYLSMSRASTASFPSKSRSKVSSCPLRSSNGAVKVRNASANSFLWRWTSSRHVWPQPPE